MPIQQSLLIKGIAILMMLMAHLYNIHEDFSLYLYIGNKPLMQYLYNISFSCVAIYTILSGYGCSYNDNKLTIKYKLIKLLKLYTTFWLVLFIFPICIGSFMRPDKYPGDYLEFLQNAIGYRWTYNLHYWFLLPYSIIFLFSNYIIDFINRIKKIFAVLIFLVLYLVASYILSRYRTGFFRIQYIYIILHVFNLLFTFVIGVIMERLNREKKLINVNIYSSLAIILLIFISITRSLFYTHALNVLYATIVVYLIIHIKFNRYIEVTLVELGKYSMPIWFIHGYFTLYLFHDYLCILKYPLLMYIALICVSYLISLLIMWISKSLFKVLNI